MMLLYCLLLYAIEIFCYKFLCVVVFRRIILVNDDFMALFLNCLNTALAFLLTMVSCHTQTLYHVEMRYIGLPNEMAFSTPLQFE